MYYKIQKLKDNGDIINTVYLTEKEYKSIINILNDFTKGNSGIDCKKIAKEILQNFFDKNPSPLVTEVKDED